MAEMGGTAITAHQLKNFCDRFAFGVDSNRFARSPSAIMLFARGLILDQKRASSGVVVDF